MNKKEIKKTGNWTQAGSEQGGNKTKQIAAIATGQVEC